MEKIETRDTTMSREELVNAVDISILTRVQKRAYKTILTFEIESPYDAKRLSYAISRFYDDYKRVESGLNGSSGICGIINEILKSHDSDSRIIDLRNPTQNDGYAIINGKRIKCECKENGGRIENMLLMNKRERKSKYVIYTIDWYSQKRYLKEGTLAPIKHIEMCKIMRISEFIEMLENCNAIRTIEHKGTYDCERSIKVSNAKMHKALEQFRDYERNKAYYFE